MSSHSRGSPGPSTSCSTRGAGVALTPVASLQWLLDFHKVRAYVGISANAIAGSLPSSPGVRSWRGKWLWIVTIVAESMMMLQVLVGVALVGSDDYVAALPHVLRVPRALTVGIAYSYRQQDGRPLRAVLRARRAVHHGPRSERSCRRPEFS